VVVEDSTYTYEVEIVVFDGEEWENDEPKHTVCKHHGTCICLSINSKQSYRSAVNIRKSSKI